MAAASTSTPSADPGDRGAIAFAEKLLLLLDQGRRAATYKFAVLLARVDVCLESTLPGGEGPATVTTRQLAERVVDMYWPHTSPFADRGDAVVLRQNSGGQAEIVTLIRNFRERSGADPSTPLARSRHAAPKAFEKLLLDVEWKLAEMPLPRLQLVGERLEPFVYPIGWDTTIRRAEFESDSFDRRLHLVGSAGDHLVRLAPLIRPLVEGRWALLVAQLNPDQTDEARLHRFLFGSERVSLDALRGPLRELQDNACFYCGGALRTGVEVDHFVPWARYPDNAVENLVAADAACNNAKRDFLAASEHVARWAERVRPGTASARELAGLAAGTGFESAPGRVLSVARATYLRLPPEVQLWRAGRDFVAADHAALVAALGRPAT